MKGVVVSLLVAQKGVGDQPQGLTLRVTSSDGQSVDGSLPGTVTAGKSVAGKSQFD